MKIMKRFVITIFLCVLIIRVGIFADADTVVMKSGEQVKGVVVEDYNDRIILSTVDGEREIMRDNIERVIYDLEEQNFASLADYYQDRGLYKKAHYYYNKALEINPDYKKARDGLGYVEVYLQHTGRRLKLQQLNRRNEEIEWLRKGGSTVNAYDDESGVKKELGLILKEVNGRYVVSSMVANSPAKRAGIRRKDILVTAWGRALTYMEPTEVEKKLLTPGVMDVHVSIERAYFVNLEVTGDKYSSILGAKLDFSDMEGLIFTEVYPGGPAEKIGIKEKDAVVSLQGQSTRYMPFKEVERIVTSRKGDSLSVRIRRDMVIWRKS